MKDLDFWKTGMAAAPVAPGAIAAFEKSCGFVFPAAFRGRMSARNGGLVRVGAAHYWLAAIPGPRRPFPHAVMWMGRDCADLASVAVVARGWRDFPAQAVPIGLRLFTNLRDGVLCLLRAPERPEQLLDEVWLWHWSGKPLRRLLDSTEKLWRDDPFRVPRPKQDWRVGRVKLALPANLAPRARAARGTADRPEDLGWTLACRVEIHGARLGVTDAAGGDWEDCPTASTEPGPHDLSIRPFAFGKERRVGALRLLRQGANPTRRTEVGAIDVDLASVLLVDLDPLRTCDEIVLDALLDRLPELALTDKLLGLLAFGPTTMVQAGSGLGDGTYSIYQLHADGSPVGVEIEFLKA